MFRVTNWRKRVSKYKDNQLQPDEQIVATLVLQVKGGIKRGAIAGGVGGIGGGVVQSPSLAIMGGVLGSRAAQRGKTKLRAWPQNYQLPLFC